MDEFIFQNVRIEFQFRFCGSRSQQLHDSVCQDESRFPAVGEIEILLPTDGFKEGKMLTAHDIAAARAKQDV